MANTGEYPVQGTCILVYSRGMIKAEWTVYYTHRPNGILKEGHLNIATDTEDIPAVGQAVAEAQRQYPWMKFTGRAERVYRSESVRNEHGVRVTPDVAEFLLALSGRPDCLYIECRLRDVDEVRDKYFRLTGERVSPEPGKFNISPEEKWGIEGTVNYTGIPFPSSDLGIQPYRDGCVNSVALFWALVRIGFRLSGKHDEESILKVACA